MKKRTSFASTGILSLILIFSVLAMMVLTLLTYQSSLSELKEAELSFSAFEAYCQAEKEAVQYLQDLKQDINYTSVSVTEDSTLQFTIPYSSFLSLIVELVPEKETEDSILYRISRWESQNLETWEADQTLPVYQPGE